jgi:hypothetical protein
MFCKLRKKEIQKTIIYKVFIIFFVFLSLPISQLTCNQKKNLKQIEEGNLNQEAPLQMVYYGNKF